MLAATQKCTFYVPRRPELTPLYQIVSSGLSHFAAARQREERPLPDYVLREFEAYLKCGILAHGFLRLKCGGCAQEKVVAFSCKKRGFCPSCTGKRMTEAAAHLVDNVLPFISYRQFVISFPFVMRFWLETNQRLFAKIHKIVIGKLHQHYIDKAKSQGVQSPTPGSISFTQRFGSAANLHIHLHVLMADGVYTVVKDMPRFRKVNPITDKEVAQLITGISQAVMRYLKKKGYLDQEGQVVLNPRLIHLIVTMKSCPMLHRPPFKERLPLARMPESTSSVLAKALAITRKSPWPKASAVLASTAFLSMRTLMSIHCNGKSWKA